MEKKINLFTALIFAYSVIVCLVCKKDNESTLLSSHEMIHNQDRNISTFSSSIKVFEKSNLNNVIVWDNQ